jgi:Ni,Fe-hydrogenase maturation factor
MEILVFGNQDVKDDSLAFRVIRRLKNIPGIKFKIINPNEDLPLTDNNHVTILDAVAGINKITLFTEKDLDKFAILPCRTTAHDYDLGFQLKYLKKLKKLKNMTIIGLPMRGQIDYSSLHSILRKLVAQDMQGS